MNFYFSVDQTTPRIKMMTPISLVVAQRTRRVEVWGLQVPLLLLFLPQVHLVAWVTQRDHHCHRARHVSTLPPDFLVNRRPSTETDLISILRWICRGLRSLRYQIYRCCKITSHFHRWVRTQLTYLAASSRTRPWVNKEVSVIPHFI